MHPDAILQILISDRTLLTPGDLAGLPYDAFDIGTR
jgi:hypothetical protein